MANEIGIPLLAAPTGTPYALVRNSINQIWDDSGNSLVAYVTANLGLYDLPMTEQGAASRYFTVSFPTHANLIPGVYTIQIFDRLGGAPAETDTYLGGFDNFEWDGGVEVDPNLIHMDLAFDIDDGNSQDEYTTIFKINGFEIGTAAFTAADPSITVRERDDSVLVAAVLMTQVGVTSQWIYDETVNRVVIGEAYFVTVTVELYGITRIFTETIRRDD